MKKSLLFGLILLANIFLFVCCDYNAEMSALKTLRKINDGVFYIEYEGDYRLDEYIKDGGGKTNDEMADYMSQTRHLPRNHYLVMNNWQNDEDFENLPEKELNPIDEWMTKSKTRKYMGWGVGGLAAAALLFAIFLAPQ